MKTSNGNRLSSENLIPHKLLSICVSLFLVECAITEAAIAATSSEPQSPVAEAIASERPFGDAMQDTWRKSREVLTFMDLKPGMQVLDYLAAGGYNSELLARVVGPTGSVIVYNSEEYAKLAGPVLAKRFENNRLPNAQVLTAPTDQLKLDPNSLDGVLFVMAYHDLYWTPKGATAPLGNPEQVNADLFRAVKPGGVIVVVDHVANPGTDSMEVAQTIHRIDPQVVKNDFAKAGFVFDGESTVLHHAEDDHTKRVGDALIRFRTDRFIFRFRKPIKK